MAAWPCNTPDAPPLRGVVHDPTARRMGGVAGHAGLFGTARDLSRFARMLLGDGRLETTRVLAPMTVAKMSSPATPSGMSSVRGLGWDIDTSYSGNRGELFPIGSFGHTGFTGTSLWIDPERGVYVILLTNRVNPTRQNTRIGGVRTGLANAAIRAMGGSPVFTTSTSSAPSPAPATPAAATPRPAALPTPP